MKGLIAEAWSLGFSVTFTDRTDYLPAGLVTVGHTWLNEKRILIAGSPLQYEGVLRHELRHARTGLPDLRHAALDEEGNIDVRCLGPIR